MALWNYYNATVEQMASSIASLFYDPPPLPAYLVRIVTGDRIGAGTDANVYFVLFNENDLESVVIKASKLWTNDHERNCTTVVQVGLEKAIEGPIARLQLWRDRTGTFYLGQRLAALFSGGPEKDTSHWFLDRIEVESVAGKETWVFPVLRWIEPNRRYNLFPHDCCLPQDSPIIHDRKEELEEKTNSYVFQSKVPNGPAQVRELPSDEKFSEDYYISFLKEKARLVARAACIKWTPTKWDSIDALKKVYKGSLGEPEAIKYWDQDWWFGIQRLQGVNPMVIKLCHEIPYNLDVTEDTLLGLLDGLSLREALSQKRIFVCDLGILDGLECKDNKELAAPLALFFLKDVTREGVRAPVPMPVAIQLRQRKGPDAPVFTPKDPPSTWLAAKMFYNNAEAQHHQGVTHLAHTHLLMEGVCVCTHRNLSPSHPLFKLMAPHFLFLLAINARGLEKLLSEGGWVDKCMTLGVSGMFALIIKALDAWHYDSHGSVERELESRGVLDPKVLPYYPYRDDAVAVAKVIRTYVDKVVRHYYDSHEKLMGDTELISWRRELVQPRGMTGVGLQGLPGTDEGFESVGDVVDVVSAIIAVCSVGHSAANFQQYEQFGFIPNYPGVLMEAPPSEKKEYTEKDLINLLPNKDVTLDSMVITKLLSMGGTKPLGDFEMQYLYHPVDVQAVTEFRKDLQRLSCDIKRTNVDRFLKFPHLDPDKIPNSISI